MTVSQLSIHSTRASDIAHRLARRENRSVADIVERALEAYEVREAGRELASEFYDRLSKHSGTDLDLEAVIKEDRKIHKGIAF